MPRPFVFLFAAIACEVLWAVMLKLSAGFSVVWATALMALAYVLSLVCLNVACKQLDISLAYAIWTGTGAALVALIGVCAFGEPLGYGRACGFLLVVSGVVVLLGFEQRLA